MEKLITQLKRRQVFKVATIYAVSAWPLIQIADLSVPALGLPDSVMTLLLKIFIAGFPVSLMLAWLFNVTRQGIVRATAETDDKQEPQANMQTTAAVAGTLVLVLFITLIWQTMLDHQPTPITAKAPAAERGRSGVDRALPVTPVGDGKESIAILPFVAFSSDPQDEFFADGMVEELLNLLAKLPDLRVAARTSSFAYKGVTNKTIPEIGLELGVDTILEGSIRKNDTSNKIRITAQLIKVSTGEHLWSQTYDREYKDIFKIQDDIASAVVDKMKLTLFGGSQQPHFNAPTDSVDAMVAYGKGQKQLGHRTVLSIRKAMAHFEQAIALDSNYARAWVGIADAQSLLALYGNVPAKQARQTAQKAIDKALMIDDQLGAAYATQGLLLRMLEPVKAEAAFKKAMSLNPNYAPTYMWYAALLGGRGEAEASHNMLKRAFKLDPKSPVVAYLLANSYYNRGNETKTMELFSHIVANDPYYPDAYNLVGQILLSRGRLDESISMFKRALDVDTLNKGAVQGLIVATTDMGSYDHAQQWFEYAQHHEGVLEGGVMSFMKFRYHLSQGHKSKAFAALEQASIDKDLGHAGMMKDMMQSQKTYYQGDYAGAIAALERLRHQPQNKEEAFYKMDNSRVALHLAHAYAQMEMTDKFNALIAGIENYLDKNKAQQKNNPAYYYAMAMVRTMQHKNNEAFYYLQGAIDVGWIRAWEAELEPILKPVNEELQFTLMMGGVKARLATMRARMADEEAFMLAGTEEI